MAGSLLEQADALLLDTIAVRPRLLHIHLHVAMVDTYLCAVVL